MMKEALMGATAKARHILKVASILMVMAVIACATVVFFYTDYSDTLDNSVMLAEAISKGQFARYYEYAAHNAHSDTVFTANYNFLVYFVFMIWNLPTVIMHLSTGFDYMNSGLALLWCKSLIVISLIGIAGVLRRILALHVDDREKALAGSIVFLGSACTVVSALVACQYDSLFLWLILWGIYHCLRGNQFLFVLFFTLAQPFKSFALFFYIPLLLLHEKRLHYVVLKLLPVPVFSWLLGLPFRGEPYYEMALGSQNRDAMGLLLGSNVGIGGRNINLFVVALICISVYAYLQEDDGVLMRMRKSAFVSACVAFSIVGFIPIRSYWCIIAVPFAVLLSFVNPKKYTTSLAATAVGTMCYGIFSISNHWIYSTPKLVSKLLLRTVMDIPASEGAAYGSIRALLEKMDFVKYEMAFLSAFVAAAALLLVINYPRDEERGRHADTASSPTSLMMWCIPLFEACATAGLCILLVYANVAVGNRLAFEIPLGDPVEYAETNLFSVADVTQPFQVESGGELDRISFFCTNDSAGRDKRGLLVANVIDVQSGEVLGESKLGTPLIQNGPAEVELSFDGLVLEAGRQYALRLSTDQPEQSGGHNSLRLAIVQVKDGREPAMVDTELQEYSLPIRVLVVR